MSDYPIVPYKKGEVGPVVDRGPDWAYGRDQAPIIIDIPGPPKDEEEELRVPDWFGKTKEKEEEDEEEDGKEDGKRGFKDSLSSEAREELRRRLEADRELEDLAGRVTREELEAKLREYRQKFKKPSKFEKLLKGTGRTWKGIKEVAGPKTPIKG